MGIPYLYEILYVTKRIFHDQISKLTYNKKSRSNKFGQGIPVQSVFDAETFSKPLG